MEIAARVVPAVMSMIPRCRGWRIVDRARAPRSTMLGSAAIEIDGVVTSDCAIERVLKYGDRRSDNFRAVSTTVEGRTYVVGRQQDDLPCHHMMAVTPVCDDVSMSECLSSTVLQKFP